MEDEQEEEEDPSESDHDSIVTAVVEPQPVLITGATNKDDFFGNNGLYNRWLHTRRSQAFDMIGPLHLDVFQQEKYMVNNVDIALKLTRSKPEFYLMSNVAAAGGNRFKCQIEEATLYVRKVVPNDAVFLAHQAALLRSNAIYPTDHVVVKSFSIPMGNLVGPQDNIFLGQLPTHMVVGFVDNKAQSGDLKKNPFNFEHKDISHFVAKYAGRQVPAKPLVTHYITEAAAGTTDWVNGGVYARVYQNFFMGTDTLLSDKDTLIQREDFPRGYALYAFDFRPDIGSRGVYDLKKTGSVQLDVQFGSELTQTTNMIVYATFDNYFEVTKSREIVAPS